MSSMPTSPAQQLRALADRPEDQARYAVTLLRPKQARDLLQAALTAVRRYPLLEARTPLLKLYAHFSEQPEKRDPGGYMRRPLLDALRPLAMPEDLPLFLAAVATYERYPPKFQEEAGLVRAAGLVALNELDDRLACFHAARLLADLAHTDAMSGEPAMTATGVLAAHDELMPLYLYATLPPSLERSEVTAECLRSLTALPAALLGPLTAQYADCEDSLVLVGLFDLLLGHQSGLQEEAFLSDLLARAKEPDLYRYLTTALVAASTPATLDLLLASIRWETDRERCAIAREALMLRTDEPRVVEALIRLDQVTEK
jgi:hypothetical protein